MHAFMSYPVKVESSNSLTFAIYHLRDTQDSRKTLFFFFPFFLLGRINNCFLVLALHYTCIKLSTLWFMQKRPNFLFYSTDTSFNNNTRIPGESPKMEGKRLSWFIIGIYSLFGMSSFHFITPFLNYGSYRYLVHNDPSQGGMGNGHVNGNFRVDIKGSRLFNCLDHLQ
jgi:hypothetical protein